MYKRQSYDKMGNILSLIRYGLRDDNKYGLIDHLTYGYNGNQLTKVDDTVSGPYHAGAVSYTHLHNWKYLNLPMEEIAQLAIASLKDGHKTVSYTHLGT